MWTHVSLRIINSTNPSHSANLLLGRPVFTHEFAISADALRQEAERAWTYQVGVTSEKEREERVQESIERLERWGEANDKQVIKFPLQGGEKK